MKNIISRSSMLDPLNNFFFYKIFGEKGDEIQLLSFINAVLEKTREDKITSLEILENKSFMADITRGKSCVLDVRAQLQCGEMVNIEVQLRNKHNMDRRSLFYMSKLYSRELNEGEDYLELPNVIAINIVDFDFPDTKDFHSCFHLREDEEPEIILTKALEIHFINMVKYRKKIRKMEDGKGLDDSLSRWLTWLNKDSPSELLEEIIKMDDAIQTADNRFTFVSQDKEAYWAYTRHMLAECDRTSEINYARDEGFEQGSSNKAKVIASNLLAEGSTPEFIQRATGLTIEQIEKL